MIASKGKMSNILYYLHNNEQTNVFTWLTTCLLAELHALEGGVFISVKKTKIYFLIFWALCDTLPSSNLDKSLFIQFFLYCMKVSVFRPFPISLLSRKLQNLKNATETDIMHPSKIDNRNNFYRTDLPSTLFIFNGKIIFLTSTIYMKFQLKLSRVLR